LQVNSKVTQIRIHDNIGTARKVSSTAQASTDIPETKPEETKTSDSSLPSSGTPKIEDVDKIEDAHHKASYGEEHFLPLKKLGSGSFGDVYLVRDKNSGKLYAMKTLSKRKILG